MLPIKLNTSLSPPLQLFFVQTASEFTCLRSRHTVIRHGPRGGEMLPPLPLVGKREERVGFLKLKKVRCFLRWTIRVIKNDLRFAGYSRPRTDGLP